MLESLGWLAGDQTLAKDFRKRTVAHGPFVQARKPNFVSIGAVSAGIVRKLRS